MKPIEVLARQICEHAGSCPADVIELGFEVKNGCDKVCGEEGRNSTSMHKCWIEWAKFESKAEKIL